MSFRGDSPPPPLLPYDLRPKDSEIASGEEQLRKALKKYLSDVEDHFANYINGTSNEPWFDPLCPEILQPLVNHCVGYGGILRGDHTKHHFYTVVETLESQNRGPVWAAHVKLRMMQLNLAGDDDFAKTWKDSLMYLIERLAHLVFESNNGIDTWDTEVVRRKEAVCAACRSAGRRDDQKGLGDTVTVLPCSNRHTIHRGSVAEWTNNKRYCPECGEYILYGQITWVPISMLADLLTTGANRSRYLPVTDILLHSVQ